MKSYLAPKPRKVRVMTVTDLTLMIDNSEKIIFVHDFRAERPKAQSSVVLRGKDCDTDAKLFSFSFSFKAIEVNGAMLIVAGNRTGVSSFRAVGLSEVLCSKRCIRKGQIPVPRGINADLELEA